MKQRNEDGLVNTFGRLDDRNRRSDKPDQEPDEGDPWVVASNSFESAETVPSRQDERRESQDEPLTRVYRPGGRVSSETGPMSDPPAGWLVIVDGPGKGNAVTLGYGVNGLGRDRTERVTLDYGDTTISRVGHAAVTYDASSRKFYVQHGGGVNLSYVNDEPVLAPVELEPFAHIRIGDTTLRFVPLCGPGFSWEDREAEG